MPGKKYNLRGYGSESRKDDTKKVGSSKSHSKIKEEKKAKWMLSDTGALRTKVSFPKSNKSTVGGTKKLFHKRSAKTNSGYSKGVFV